MIPLLGNHLPKQFYVLRGCPGCNDQHYPLTTSCLRVLLGRAWVLGILEQVGDPVIGFSDTPTGPLLRDICELIIITIIIFNGQPINKFESLQYICPHENIQYHKSLRATPPPPSSSHALSPPSSLHSHPRAVHTLTPSYPLMSANPSSRHPNT